MIVLLNRGRIAIREFEMTDFGLEWPDLRGVFKPFVLFQPAKVLGKLKTIQAGSLVLEGVLIASRRKIF